MVISVGNEQGLPFTVHTQTPRLRELCMLKWSIVQTGHPRPSQSGALLGPRVDNLHLGTEGIIIIDDEIKLKTFTEEERVN